MNYITPLIGVIIGACIQYFFSIKKHKKKERRDVLRKAYVDYVVSISKLAIAQKANNQADIYEYTKQLTDAKTRMCISGSKKVLKKISDFSKLPNNVLDNINSKNKLTEILNTMRKDILDEQNDQFDNIYNIVFQEKN